MGEPELIIELWSRVKHFIPAKERLEAADHFISVFDDYGMVDGLNEHQESTDRYLKAAMKSHFGCIGDEGEDDSDD